MRPYATVSPLFWTGSTGKRLRSNPDAQRIALYLMTCPHSHQSGLYYLPMMYLCHETGSPLEGAYKALEFLESEGFCKYDRETEWVWVCEMAAWQIGGDLSANDKRCKGLQQYVKGLPDLPFMADFVTRYASDFHLDEPPRRGLEGASSEQSGTEQEQEQEQTRKPRKRASAPPVNFDPASIPNLDHAAWRLWVEHRSEIKKPIRPHAMADAAEELAKLGDRQMAEVKRARAGGWQGLHPEERKPGLRVISEPPKARAFPS